MDTLFPIPAFEVPFDTGALSHCPSECPNCQEESDGSFTFCEGMEILPLPEEAFRDLYFQFLAPFN